MTRKWTAVNYLSDSQNFVNKKLNSKTPMLISDFCDYSDAYIIVKKRRTVEGTNPVKWRNKKLTSKKITPFRSFISKINNTVIHNTENFDIAMLMYNLLEYMLQYSDNYSVTSGSLWNYYRDKLNDDPNEIVVNHRLHSNQTTTSKSFEYKTKIIGRAPANNDIWYTDFDVTLKWLNNFLIMFK